MSIIVNIQLTGESGGEIANDLRHLLNSMTAYKGEPIAGSSEAAVAALVGGAGNEPKRMTAAQQKAAEKAAKEAALIEQQKAAGAGATETASDAAAGKQDAKDEAAESAKVEIVKLTHDSVRKMLGGYVMAYGMEAAQADGVGLIGTAKISDLADDQKVLAAAVIAIGRGIEANPNKREIAGDGITAEKMAELKPVVAAALAVK